MSYSIQSLSGKDRKILVKQLKGIIEDPEVILPRKTPLFRFTFDKRESIIVKNRDQVVLLEVNEQIIPSLHIARDVKLLVPSITVDVGAIRFVTNGADIMRPGITEIDDNVLEGDLVVIVEERNGAPIAFGRALYDAVDLKQKDGGKCVKTVHYLKDKFWSFDFE